MPVGHAASSADFDVPLATRGLGLAGLVGARTERSVRTIFALRSALAPTVRVPIWSVAVPTGSGGFARRCAGARRGHDEDDR